MLTSFCQMSCNFLSIHSLGEIMYMKRYLVPLVEHVGGKDTIKCYQCTVYNSSQCTDEYLKDCPDNQAYDVCQTTVTKIGELMSSINVHLYRGCPKGNCVFSEYMKNIFHCKAICHSTVYCPCCLRPFAIFPTPTSLLHTC